MDSLEEIVGSIEGILSLAAVAGLLILVPLYLSQRRDVERLRSWMEREPDHPRSDLVASEALLDRAETELEELLAGRGEEVPGAAADVTAVQPTPPAPVTPAGRASPAARVTSERPALERITMERAALQPHPSWRRYASQLAQPRYLIAIGLAALLLGGAGILASERLLESGDREGPGQKPGAVVPAEVSVAVLNGTSVPGLAGKVGDDVEANGFELGSVATSERQLDQTIVMFEPGQKRAANKVAHDLGVRPVQPIDALTRRSAQGADVVVIAGQDRAL